MSQVVKYKSVPLNGCCVPCQIEVHSAWIEMHLSRHRARFRLCRCRRERVCSLIPQCVLHFDQPGGHACGMLCVQQLDHMCDKLTRGIAIEIQPEMKLNLYIGLAEANWGYYIFFAFVT
jgi:hypothetical protein